MEHQKKLKFSYTIAAASTLFAVSALAQQTPPAAGDGTATAETSPKKTDPKSAQAIAASSQLADVVVTAQKRKEDPAKIAMSISTIRGSDLQAQHIGDFGDLTRAIPNISFSGGNGAGSGLDNIELRGISSSAGSSTVGIYLDDVSVTVGNIYTMGSIEPKFFDIDRVEVLRGPQGTLYGASSMGGTIKFIGNQPILNEKEISVYSEASSTKGGGINYNANLVANLPLIQDELALRIGTQVGRKGGFINQVDGNGNVIAKNINSGTDQEARVAMNWKPTRDLSITPSVYYQNVDSHDIDAFNVNLPGYVTDKQVREPGVDTLIVPSLTIGYKMGDVDLTSVTSYFQRKFDRVQNGSVYNSHSAASFITDAAPPGLYDAVYALPSAVYLNNQVRQFSEEVRLASKPYAAGGSPWTWVAGAYLSNQHTNLVETDPIFGINKTFAAFGADPADPTVLAGAFPNDFPNDNSYLGPVHYHDQQHSIFGEANYYFSPSFHATVGARYLKATDELVQSNYLFLSGTAVGNATSATVKSSAFTPKLSLTWEADTNNTWYATAGKGYRLGGGNFYVPSTICAVDLNPLGITNAPSTYDSDSLWSYEIGNKSRFFGNRVSVNADIFYSTWKNIQQQVSLPDCGYYYSTNVGNATAKGAEIEIKAKPVDGLLLGFSAGYTRAVLSDSTGFLNEGIPGAVAGAEIEGVPKYNAAITAQYNFSVLDGRSAFVLGAMHWVGSSHGVLDPNALDYIRPGYHTLDISAGLSLGKFDFTVFIKNLMDNNTIIQHPTVASVPEGFRVEPRSIGISVSTKF